MIVMVFQSLGDSEQFRAPPEPPATGSSTAQPPPPASPRLYAATLRFNNVNSGLASLSQHGGFRNYMCAKATEFGITGYIQRFRHKDVLFYYEGTSEQVNDLFNFLSKCLSQRMIESITYSEAEREIRAQLHRSFIILADYSRSPDQNGKTIKGCYSNEHMYDKNAECSRSSSPTMMTETTF